MAKNGVVAWLAAGLASLSGPGMTQAQTAFPVVPSELLVQDCGASNASADICRARQAVDAGGAARRLGEGALVAWREGTRLLVVARSSADDVGVAGAIQAPMARIDRSADLWSLVVEIPRLDEALLDLFVTPAADGFTTFLWRGPKAPKEPAFQPRLDGRVVKDQIASVALGATRGLTIYLPPGFDAANVYPVAYVADGRSVAYYARIVEPAIAEGLLLPLVLIGLDGGAGDQRAKDYLMGRGGSDAPFEAHERFLLEEVMPRAEKLYGASTRREQRLLMGKSNGGAWALDTALRHPDLFAQAAPMAVGYAGAGAGVERPGRPRLFMVTGLLDPFITRSRTLVGEAAKSGDPLIFQTPVSGHGDAFYKAVLVEALAWAFPPGERPRATGG